MIEAGIRSLLLEQSSITGIARPGVVDGVTYPGVFNEYAPQGFRPPFVVVRQIDSDPMGDLTDTDGLESTEFEIDACARSYDEAQTLARNIARFFRDYEGEAGPEDVIEAVIMGSKRVTQLDEETGADSRLHVVTRAFQVMHHGADNDG